MRDLVAYDRLPAPFAADPDRLRRFELEARAPGMLKGPAYAYSYLRVLSQLYVVEG
jgi:hypothetical protein